MLAEQTGGRVVRHGDPFWMLVVTMPSGCRAWAQYDPRPDLADPAKRLKIGGLCETADGKLRPVAESEAAAQVLAEVLADVRSGADDWTPERVRERWRQLASERQE